MGVVPVRLEAMMTGMRGSGGVAAAGAILMVLGGVAAAAETPERFTGRVVNMGGPASGTLLPLSQIRFTEEGRIEVKTFGTQPAKVLNLKAEQVQEKG